MLIYKKKTNPQKQNKQKNPTKQKNKCWQGWEVLENLRTAGGK